MSDEIPDGYGFGHVVVRSSVGQSTTGKYHLADPDDPDEPRCNQGLRNDESSWQRADPDALPWRFSLCQACNPEIDTDPELDFGDPDSVGEMTAHQIRAAVREGEIDVAAVFEGGGR